MPTASDTAPDTPPRRPRRLRRILALILLAWIASAVYHVYKPLPAGTSLAGPLRSARDVALLTDITWTDPQGARHSDQHVFDETLRLIGQADRAIVADQFLFNDFGSEQPGETRYRKLSQELTDALIARKRARPALTVVLITDPINTVYGGRASPHLEQLRAAGIEVVITDLARLRTPNPAWSGLWQLCCRWAGNDSDGGWLPNPLGPGQVGLRSWLALLNLNANHRKTLVVDQGEDWTALVASANPHDASSLHGNVAVRFSGAAALDLLASERAVAAFSGAAWPRALPTTVPRESIVDTTSAPRVQVLTEARIRDALLAAVDGARGGDRLDIAVFYFSHRRLVDAVAAAHKRGVGVRVLLDPNEDAFGRKKNGVPNRQVAAELVAAGVPLRWCDTHGEQCHAKLLLRTGSDGKIELIAGSANYTRRNLDDYNLESSARVVALDDAPVAQQARAYFEQSWSNAGGRTISADYARYADDSALRKVWYRIAEASGLSSF
ncbi:phospholipase D family protein [Lysobacter enzymogenes]|uniref:phospholipase D family protein n=1 Tax=Lysobacter enzymogenes TaxID=69 RepID=UPI001A97400B|nr:phospholipase D family protein [Lysobacter enzymogenes]QQP96812.1 phospholipase D family protein [Lysobacter enzymogenes]